MQKTWREVQQRLIDLGYDLGPSGADGDPGRYTKEAIRKFQADKKIPVQWPGTVGEKTIAALFPEGDSSAPAPKPAALVRAPWVAVGLRAKGLREDGSTKGALVKFLKSDGKTLGDPQKNPWCGDYVQTCMAIAVPEEVLPTNPYYAKNWLQFGKEIEPTFGAVGVWTREGGGHVAFILGVDEKNNFVILGGNQSNQVSVTSKSRKGFLGARWPIHVDRPDEPLARMKGGKLSVNEA